MRLIDDLQDGMKQLKCDRREFQKFAFVVSSALLIWAILLFWLGKSSGPTFVLSSITVVLLLAALLRPSVLKPIYKAWMFFALLLGALVSRMILTVFFYIILTPIGIMMRVCGKDPLSLKRPEKRTSYWQERQQVGVNIETYKRLF